MSLQHGSNLAALEDWFMIQKIWKSGGLNEAHVSLDSFLGQAAPGDRNMPAASASSNKPKAALGARGGLHYPGGMTAAD